MFRKAILEKTRGTILSFPPKFPSYPIQSCENCPKIPFTFFYMVVLSPKVDDTPAPSILVNFARVIVKNKIINCGPFSNIGPKFLSAGDKRGFSYTFTLGFCINFSGKDQNY